MDYLQFIFQAINNLLTQNVGFFDAMGQNLFRSFATILVVWYGVKSALSSAGGRHFLHFDNFASLLLTVSFGFAMVNYYSAPIPGVGASFHNLITDESQFLANKINQTELQTVEERIADFEIRMDSPAIADVLGTVIYVVIIILLASAQAIAIVVIAFGFIATAVCVLVGPVFIPFFIVPKLEWLFWGWLRCFIQYAFYPVVANAFIFVFGEMLIHFLDTHPSPWNAQTIAALFVQLVFLLIAFIWGLLKVPSLVNSIFAGRSGESATPGIVGRFRIGEIS